jgi:sensor c-di-GMP phosphodiesterase-like protein
VDDFGSGYINLRHLIQLKVVIVKFDKAFLSELTTQQSKSRILLPSLISLCHELGYQSLCEGVETSEQVEFLRQTNCRFVQGYFYGKAMPLSEVLALSQGEPLVLVHPPRHPA